MKLACLLGLVAGAFAMPPMQARDSNDQCCGWAIMDECETNPFWMKVNCQKSCGTTGCTVAGAKADKDGATGACRSSKDMNFLSGCAWNREFLEANWNRNSHAGQHGHGGEEKPEESQFIVPEAKSHGSYGGEEKPAEAPMDVPMETSMVMLPMNGEEDKLVDPVEEEPVLEIVEPEAPVGVQEEIPLPVEVPEEPAPAPAPVVKLEIDEPLPVEEPEIVVEEIMPEEEIPMPVEEVALALLTGEMPEEEAPMAHAVAQDEPAVEEAPMAEDKHDSCCGWAAYEECGKNSAWMKVNCAKSCFVADGAMDEDAAIATAEEKCSEYRELFLAGVPLGEAKKAEEEKKKPEAPVEEKEASEEKAPEEPEAPVEEIPEEPEIEPEAPVEEIPEEPEIEPEAPVEEPEVEEPVEEVPEEPEVEEPQADPMSHGPYRRRFSRFRASRN